MFKFTVFIFASILTRQIFGTEGSPPLCGPIPNEVYTCLTVPKMASLHVARQCQGPVPECEKITCIFRAYGWLDGDKVDKVKVSAHFDKIAKDYPEWAQAVEQTKIKCLTNDLPAQGIHLNCPAYDTVECAFATFIKNTQESQWKSLPQCSIARQYAASCPVCPNDCFSVQIPIGSCNACITLPRTP